VGSVQTLSPIAEESGPLASLLEDEPEELTIRRVFTPKKPARVEVEIGDADATWKWERPIADAQGRFLALALPVLDDDRAVEFDHSEAEVTREMASPFALTPAASAIPLAQRRRRTRRVAPPKQKPTFLRANYARIALIAGAALVAFTTAFVLVGRDVKITLGMSAGIAEAATTLELPPIPLKGTIIPTTSGPVYVDGERMDSSGPISVDCGTRLVKLGGVTKSVAVPCGGEIKISP